jgi:hypothetical protein
MALTRYRIGAVVVLAAAAVVAATFFRASPGHATAAPTVVPLAKSRLSMQASDFIRGRAIKDGVDPDSLVEVGAFQGGTTRAAIVGRGIADRVPYVSFYQGFGMTYFQSPAHLFPRGEQMTYSEGYSGPKDATERVGIVGATRPSVDHVTIEVGDGRVLEARLASSSGMRFFAYTGNSPADFPKTVRAYDASGKLVATHEVPAL